jgi:hypothetical protein
VHSAATTIQARYRGGWQRSLLSGGSGGSGGSLLSGGGGMATPAAHRHPDGCEDHLDIAAKQDEDPLPSDDPITQFLGGDSAEEAAAGSPCGKGESKRLLVESPWSQFTSECQRF